MNYLWPFLIIISYLFAIIHGNIEKVNSGIFSSLSEVINMTLTILGNICLWCGIIKIIKETKIMKTLRKLIAPILNWLFPDEKNDKEVMDAISINIISNMIGIGNASTPAGIKAMEEMQKKNQKKEELTNSMIMFIVLNTASIQILPTTIIAIRAAIGSEKPADIIVPIWIATLLGTTVGIISTKLLLWRQKK